MKSRRRKKNRASRTGKWRIVRSFYPIRIREATFNTPIPVGFYDSPLGIPYPPAIAGTVTLEIEGNFEEIMKRIPQEWKPESWI